MSMILSLVICKEIPVNAEEIKKTDTWNWIIDQIKNNDSEFMADRVKYLMYNAEYLPGGTYTVDRLITDTETNEIIDVMAWECMGYSRYAFYKIFGYIGNEYEKDLYEVINPDNTNSEEGVKVALSSDKIKAGANIRTNYFTIDYSDGTSERFQHSMIFLTTDENGTGFYCLDANLGGKNEVTVRHWTYKEFANIFSGGIESITVPKIYPQTGKYTITAASGLEYRTISTSNEILGIIPSGTTIEITELDPTVNTDTIILDTEPKGSRITLRAIMGKTTYDGQTAWVTTNAPNSLNYVGSLTNDPTSTSGGDLNFFQRIGAFFNAIWKAIVEITNNIIHPKDAEAASGDNVSSSSNQVDSTVTTTTAKTEVTAQQSDMIQVSLANTECGYGRLLVKEGDWIYFALDGIYRMKTDGTEINKISDTYADFLCISDGWLFGSVSGYEFYDYAEIFKVKVDGTAESVILEYENGSINSFQIEDDQLYFGSPCEFADEYDPECSEAGGIYRMNLDGSELQKIVEGDFYDFIVQSSWVYYGNRYTPSASDILYKIKNDRSSISEITPDEWSAIELSVTSPTNIDDVIEGADIILVSQSTEKYIYYYSLNTSDTIGATDNSAGCPKYTLYRINTDGTDQVEIASAYMYPFGFN